MNQSYLQKYLPKFVSVLADKSPQSIMRFRAHYETNPSALDHFNVQKLLTNPELWLVGTDIAKAHNEFLQEVYPQQTVATAPSELRSIIVCGSCKQSSREEWFSTFLGLLAHEGRHN
jgi:hypothetical protein